MFDVVVGRIGHGGNSTSPSSCIRSAGALDAARSGNWKHVRNDAEDDIREEGVCRQAAF